MTQPQRRNDASQIEERAKAIWKAMVEEASAKSLPRVETEYGSGFYVEGSLAEFARACWPGTNFRKGTGKTAMNMIRQFLRSTGNVVTIRSGGRGKSTCFVRAYWAYRDSIPVIVGISPERRQAIEQYEAEQRRKEAKVTAEEAGETRTPAPVETKKGAIVSHPEYGKGEKDKRYPTFVRFSNGMAQCGECGRVIKPQGMGPHQKMHDDIKRDERLEELEAAARAGVSSTDIHQVMAMLGAHIGTIIQQRDHAKAELVALQTQPVNTDAEVKVDMVKEILTRVQKGEISMMRGLSDINDALEA